MPSIGDLLLENTVLMICLLPFIGAGLVVTSAGLGLEAIRRTALLNAMLTVGFAVFMVAAYDPTERDESGRMELVQMAKSLRWLGEEQLGTPRADDDGPAEPELRIIGPDIRIAVGVDGISMWFVLLTALLMIPALAISTSIDDDTPAMYYGLLLGLQGTLITAFAALDLVLFAICLELSLLLTAALIGRWGGRERQRVLARFFVANLCGGVLILLGLVGLALAQRLMSASSTLASPSLTFSIPALLERLPSLALTRAVSAQYWDRVAPSLFVVLTIGFAIRVPLVPFHTWFAPSHAEAPSAVAILMSGAGMGLGVYGFLRFIVPLFPDQCEAVAPVVPAFLMAGTIFTAVLALAQDDLQKMTGYALLSSAGFSASAAMCLSTLGFAGAVLNLVSHGLAAGILLFIIGVIESQHAARDVRAFSGLATRYRRIAFFFLLGFLILIGAPGLSGFTARAGALFGIFGDHPLTVIGLLLSMLLIAWAWVWVFQKVFRGPLYAPGLSGGLSTSSELHSTALGSGFSLFAPGGAAGGESGSAEVGSLRRRTRAARDLTLIDCVALLPLCAMSLWIGLGPQFFLTRLAPTVEMAMRPYEEVTVERPSTTPSEGDSGRGDDDDDDSGGGEENQ